MLFDYRFLKIFDNLDTPERLLYWFEKKHRYGVIGCLVVGASYIGTILAEPGMDLLDYLAVAIGFIISILLFFYCGFPSWYSKEKDIIEQLRELVDKK